MKKRFMKWFVMAAMVAVIIPAASMAQGRRNTINERQKNQRERIQQGVQSGELNRTEAARLRRQEAQIKLNEARARRSGGEFTPEERARIQGQLDRESQRIYQQKHDAQDRNPNNSINERQQNQRERIQQGVRSGELTPVEAARIRNQEAQIRLNEARARQSGGEFTPQERARIQRQLNRESRRIYRQKHDAQDRNP
jgi:CRISPR/Cas system-associated endoribonuclease Cas2